VDFLIKTAACLSALYSQARSRSKMTSPTVINVSTSFSAKCDNDTPDDDDGESKEANEEEEGRRRRK
jgi:hypothetical protein